MKRHLFLQGNIGIGKSTLIQKTILPHINDVGGYFVQRIYLKENQEKFTGFAVKPLESDKEYQLNSHVNKLTDVKGLFLFCNSKGIWEQIPLAFIQAATCFLKTSLLHGKKLILMDELGGMELQDKAFSDMVFHFLDENIPVLGVLKSPVNIEKLLKAVGEKDDTIFEGMLHRYDKIKNHKETELMMVCGTADSFVEKRLRMFIKGIFDRE